MAVNSFNAQNPPVTTKGDLFTFSTIPTRLGVGANNTVLTADSTTATGLKWGTVSGGASWSLVNAGGTAMTGATTITVSGISDADKLLIYCINASTANADAYIGIRFNGDTTSKYDTIGLSTNAPSTYSPAMVQALSAEADTYIYAAQMSNSAGGIFSLAGTFNGCNSTGIKVGIVTGGGNNGGGAQNGNEQFSVHGIYRGTSTISSISVFSTSGNFDVGTLYVYKSA